MRTAVQELSPARVRLNIEVPFDELVYPAEGVDPADGADPADGPSWLREFALEFAGGRFERETLPPAFATAVSAKVRIALSEHGLVPLRQPEVEITRFGDGLPLTASMLVDRRPQIVLPPLSTLEIGEPAGDVPVEVGSEHVTEGLNDALVGLEAGRTAQVTAVVPSGPDQGGQARVTATVTAVTQAREPALDDEFAAAVGSYTNIAELRSDLRARLARGLRADQIAAARDAAPAAVVDAEQIQVSVDELRDVIARDMDRVGVSARTYRKYLARNGVVVGLYEHARREKALIHLLKHIAVKGADGNAVDLGDIEQWLRRPGFGDATERNAASNPFRTLS